MSPRQRTPQPLERAVTKALARRAQLRAQERRTAEVTTNPAVLAPGQLPTPDATPKAAQEAIPEPIRISRRIEEPADTGTVNQNRNTGRAALPAETMSLIERLANHEPFTDPEPEPAQTAPKVAAEPPQETAVERSPDTKAIPPTAAPAMRSSGTGKPIDAFQLLLSSNPEAGDNTRDDLPAAPGLRNPRKALAKQPDSQELPSSPSAEPGSSNKVTAEDPVDTDDKERSLRNWFSPKSDPNPPAPPESDPTRD